MTSHLNLDPSWNWKKLIWTPDLLPKLKLFLWKAARNILPTGENLQRRGVLANKNCTRCGETETIDHILIQCKFAKDVWQLGPWKDTIDTTDLPTFVEMMKEAIKWTNLPPTGIIGNAFPWFCWTIWTSRNRLIFEKKVVTPQEAATKAIVSQQKWEQAQTAKPPQPMNTNSPPQSQSINLEAVFCNTDAAWRSDKKAAGLGWIFTDRDSNEISRGSAHQGNVPSAIVGEALAIREALLHAATLHINHICLRTDSQELVRAITSRRKSTELFGIQSDIDSLVFSPSSPFSSVSIVFVSRVLNGPADLLAKSYLSIFCNL